MRRAYQNNKFIVDDGTFYGVSLGYDFTAEHEWGIEEMQNKFGIKKDEMGVAGRKINKGEVFFKEDNGLCVLTSHKAYGLKEDYTAKNILAHDIGHFSSESDVECAWDESDFCVATENPDCFKYVRELYEAFLNNNIVITFLAPTLAAFENASLSLMIYDRLPKEATDQMYMSDKKHKDLYEYEKEIGVTELKEKNKGKYHEGNYFMACSPRWICYEDEKKREEIKKRVNTKYNIMFWVNYSDDDNNYGSYTAEHIIKWLSTPGLKLSQISKMGSEYENNTEG